VTDWSRDGRYLLYYELGAKTGRDLWALPLEGERKPIAVLQTPFEESLARFSPDGRWIAYMSNESGGYQVYVQAFPGAPSAPKGKWQVSSHDGDAPVWRGDGKEIYFLTQDGRPREKTFAGTGFKGVHCDTEDAWKRHRQSAAEMAGAAAEAIRAFRRDLNVVLSRGVWRIFAITLGQYQRTLDAHALLDFAGVLERAVTLLRNMEEFAQSRFRLEARYRHVLVDEFQDTNRAQWELVAQLVRGWGEGLGAADDALAPSIFIVGDRKQSIYGFRDADVAILDEASSFVEGLRPEGTPRRAISVSFRAVTSITAPMISMVLVSPLSAFPTTCRYLILPSGISRRNSRLIPSALLAAAIAMSTEGISCG